MSATVHPFVRFALTKLSRVFARPLDDDEIAAYADALDDVPPEDVRDACELLAKSERHWPRPVVIRDAVDRMHRQARPAPKPFPVPETYTDPDSGERVPLFRCAECLDRGFVPLACNEHGELLPGRVRLSWLDVDAGIVERDDAGAIVRVTRPHYRVTRCERCCKFVEPRARVSRSSYDERHNKEW